MNGELCLSKLIDLGGYNWNGINKEHPQLILSNGENKIQLGQYTNMYILSPMTDYTSNTLGVIIKWLS